MKTLLIISLVYTVCLSVVYSIAFYSKYTTGNTIVDNKWWHIAIIICSPLIVVCVLPIVLTQDVIDKIKTKKLDRERQRKEQERLKRIEQVHKEMSLIQPIIITANDTFHELAMQYYTEVILNQQYDRIIEMLSYNHTSQTERDLSVYVYLDNDEKLCVELCKNVGIGDNSKLYVETKNGNCDYDVFGYLNFEVSPYGAWVAYLIYEMRHNLPAFWHGIYSARTYLYVQEDLADTKKRYQTAIPASSEEYDVAPRIYWANTRAYISCCYWSDWKGLVREIVRIDFQGCKVKDITDIDSHILLPYDSKIFF